MTSEQKKQKTDSKSDGFFFVITPKNRPKMNACPGRHRINNGNWFVPPNKTTKECTYCEWCIEHGCVDIKSVNKVDGPLILCNCDCTNSHDQIQI